MRAQSNDEMDEVVLEEIRAALNALLDQLQGSARRSPTSRDLTERVEALSAALARITPMRNRLSVVFRAGEDVLPLDLDRRPDGPIAPTHLAASDALTVMFQVHIARGLIDAAGEADDAEALQRAGSMLLALEQELHHAFERLRALTRRDETVK